MTDKNLIKAIDSWCDSHLDEILEQMQYIYFDIWTYADNIIDVCGEGYSIGGEKDREALQLYIIMYLHYLHADVFDFYDLLNEYLENENNHEIFSDAAFILYYFNGYQI